MWGMGVWNEQHPRHRRPGLLRAYELPADHPGIAADLPEEMWNREQHAGEMEEWCDQQPALEVNKVTYRTPDYMLCSAQDYRPGEKGYQQHIWQATLGTGRGGLCHPPALRQRGRLAPAQFLARQLGPAPRRAVEGRAGRRAQPARGRLDGLYPRLLSRLGLTSTPLREAQTVSQWAFARKGDGYLALTATQGLEFDHARRQRLSRAALLRAAQRLAVPHGPRGDGRQL